MHESFESILLESEIDLQESENDLLESDLQEMWSDLQECEGDLLESDLQESFAKEDVICSKESFSFA